MGNLITVGITCFREGPLLKRCWDSIVRQTDQRFDAVLVLDGGADRATSALFDGIRYPRTRSFRNQSNLGPYQTRNRAFRETLSPLHYYVDGDDELAPNAIERVLDAVERYSDADVYYTDLAIANSAGRFTYVSSPERVDAQSFIEGESPFGANVIRKALWEKVGGYASELGWTLGDFDFYLSAYEAGAKFIRIPEHLYVYHRRVNGVSERYTAKYHEIYHLLMDRHPAVFSTKIARDRFASLGYLMSAHSLFSKMDMIGARELAMRALQLGRNVEATSLLRKIRRDRWWPMRLLRLRRKVSIVVKAQLLRLRGFGDAGHRDAGCKV